MGRLAKCRCGVLRIVETCGGYDTKCGYDNEWCRAVEVADDGDWTSFDIVDEDECQEHKERCTIPELLDKIAEERAVSECCTTDCTLYCEGKCPFPYDEKSDCPTIARWIKLRG